MSLGKARGKNNNSQELLSFYCTQCGGFNIHVGLGEEGRGGGGGAP